MTSESVFLLEVREWRHEACLSSDCSLDMSKGSSSARKGVKKLGKDNLRGLGSSASVRTCWK